ncbi:NAD-dependent epimerase/dehydratase family protein [Nonomuraea antimicrobica]
MGVRRVMVTGAAGRIGRAVLGLLAERGVPAAALVLDDPGDLPADLVVEGDATDPAAVRAALDGAGAVVHLAAIPTPEWEPAERVFAVNTQSTFTVLEEAGQAGIRHVCLAGSQAAGGLAFAARELHPAYAPIDDLLPSQAEDPYALSKLVDGLTAETMARRYGMGVVTLRLPFVGGSGSGCASSPTGAPPIPGCTREGSGRTWRRGTRLGRACWRWTCRGRGRVPCWWPPPRRWCPSRRRS